MKDTSLEEVIRSYVKLDQPNNQGWYPTLHLGCDHGRKGNRAAFRFGDGDVAFHCFNCGVKTTYLPAKHRSMPRKMERILNDLHVPDDEWKKVVFTNLSKHHPQTTHQKQEFLDLEPIELTLPKHFYKLSNNQEDKWAIIAWDYLENQRGVDPSKHDFYLSTGEGTPDAKRWKGRVIIPIYKDNKLIFWQGRDLTGKAIKKYLSPSVPKDKIMYGFDRLTHSDEPLYVTEGWFDAEAVDGIALMGNEISDHHVKWLNRSSRRKVYVPDRFGDGKRAAMKALKMGFSISTPDIGDNCKDLSDAVKKYGKLFVLKTLADNTAEGFLAESNLGVYCKYEQTYRNQKKNSDAPKKKR